MKAFTPKNEIRRANRHSKFLSDHAGEIATCDLFNQTVNTRQVRRHYARVMKKRGVV